MTRSERKAEFYRKSKWGVIVKVRVELGKMVTISMQTGAPSVEELADGWI